jgi:hypothetical protein
MEWDLQFSPFGYPFHLPKTQTFPNQGKTEGRSCFPCRVIDSYVYIDAIGVPQGVPDEFKARKQIAAGFELAVFWWSTINRNVDWINYIYYNQQSFVNYTRDAVKGIAEQLGPTSKMVWENWIALDVILSEKAGNVF